MDDIEQTTTVNSPDPENFGASPPPLNAPTTGGPTTSSPSPQGTVTSNVGTSHGTTQVAETINIHEFDSKAFAEVFDQVRSYIPVPSGRNRSYFKFEDHWRISVETQTEIADQFVGDEREIDRLRMLISQKRVLILTGELRLGKRTTAIYIAQSIMKQVKPEADEEAPHKPLEIYVVPTLDRNVVINLAEIWKNGDSQVSRFVIFKNAFSGRNEDLSGFLRQLNESSLKEFARNLTQQNSYLIFTANTSDMSQLQLSLVESSLRYELKSLSSDLLVNGLRQRLRFLIASETFNRERIDALQTSEAEQLIISELKTMPEIVEFLEEYLSAQEPLELAEAIRRHQNIKHWFRDELEPDFEAWCFALSLGLVHWSAKFKHVSWFDFEYIRRLVWFCLRRDQELFPQKLGQPESVLGEISPRSPVLTDDLCEAKSRARIFSDSNHLADQISFRNEGYPQKVWPTMFTHYRRVLAILLERFCAVVQSSDADFDRRDLCAQIIGRIGEIDPERITLTAMHRWIDSGNVLQRASVAGLYEGILASENQRYKQYFLQELAALTTGGDDDKNEKHRTLTAIAVYARIADYDPLLSMKGLEKIVRKKLVPAMTDAHHVQKYLQRTEKFFEQRLSEEEAITLLGYQEMLRDLAQRMYAQQGSTFVGVQFALCSLAVTVGPMKIFHELRNWIDSSNRETGALIALMFLFEDGIAAMLSTEKVQVSDGSEKPKSCSLIVESLTKGREPIVEMALFLVTLYESFAASHTYPRRFTRFLTECLMLQLTSWVDEGIKIQPCREALVALFKEMMRIRRQVLSDRLERLLHSNAFLKHERKLKSEFAEAILSEKHNMQLKA